jgi:hypothetical protein
MFGAKLPKSIAVKANTDKVFVVMCVLKTLDI